MSLSPADKSTENPFQSPIDAPDDYQVRGPGICPYCGDSDFDRPYFTNWGGYVGPWLLTHGVCRRCGHGFNVSRGSSNLLNIALYQIGSVILVVLALVICFNYVLPAWNLL